MRCRLIIPLVCTVSGAIACSGSEPRPVQPPPSIAGSSAQPPLAAPPAAPGAPAAESVVTVDADSPMKTPSGATYTAPKGWTVTTRGDIVVLEDANREVSITFVERKELEGDAAIAAAFRQVKPEFARKIKRVTTPPGRGGWDKHVDVDYETTTAEARDVYASARRKGDTWYVALFDGTKEGWGRRAAGARIAFSSFKASGVEEESFEGKKAHVLDEARLRELESFIEEGRKTADVPGMAVAVLQGGKVVFERGFGVRELGKKDPVTPNTLFRIASTTKPLTSLMIAVLVDEGKFGWDTPVTQVLPSFAVGDAELTRRMTMQNLLCGCTGIPYDNLGTDLEYAAVTPEAALARMRDLAPTTGFGEAYQYSNALLAAAGYAAAHALYPKRPLGAAYYEAMRAKVFGPLGMRSTTFDVGAVKRADHASAHDRSPSYEMVATPFPATHWTAPLDPSWGVWSNVRDLSKYLLMERGKGKTPEGKRVVSEANLLKRREPQSRSGDLTRYGLAFTIETYRGVQVLGHPGGAWAYGADLFFLPEHDVMAVMLTNVDFPNPFSIRVFRRKLFELLFDGRDEAREDLAYAAKTQEADFRQEMSQVDLEPDRAWLDRLAGAYEHPWFGKVSVRVEGNRGVFDAGEWQSSVGRKTEEDGTVKLVLTSPPWIGWPEFLPKEVDGKTTLHMQAWQRKVVFEPAKGK
ncbi:serine hydrolase [Sorangium sp. So ce233]|uniref:serine hydrolase domain-containing protein n=1 Tax=Sorangium sp. So ce233 TaxID=3133290 RepID=UPI003F60370C